MVEYILLIQEDVEDRDPSSFKEIWNFTILQVVMISRKRPLFLDIGRCGEPWTNEFWSDI